MDYFTESDFVKYWNDGIIILDTSVLLFLKQCDKKLAIDIIDIFMFKRENIWIPAHIEEEFNNNKQQERIKSGSCGRINEFKKRLNNSIDKVKNTFNELSQETLSEGYDTLSEVLGQVDINSMFFNLLSQFESKVSTLTDENREFLRSGIVETFYNIVFSKTATPLSEKEILSIEEEGTLRYQEQIPPGYKDKKKNNENDYGDLIIWKEILKKSKEQNKPILFITRDKKIDWFILNGKDIKSPRQELFEEVKEHCGIFKDVNIVYLDDFIKMSYLSVNKDVNVLLEQLEKDNTLIMRIEEKLNENLYTVIQEQLSDKLKDVADSDYIDIDTIQDINLTSINDIEENDDILIVNADITFYCIFDYVIKWCGENEKIRGEATVQLNINFEIEVILGENNEENKMLVLSMVDISFENTEIVEASDPRGSNSYDDNYNLNDVVKIIINTGIKKPKVCQTTYYSNLSVNAIDKSGNKYYIYDKNDSIHLFTFNNGEGVAKFLGLDPNKIEIEFEEYDFIIYDSQDANHHSIIFKYKYTRNVLELIFRSLNPMNELILDKDKLLKEFSVNNELKLMELIKNAISEIMEHNIADIAIEEKKNTIFIRYKELKYFTHIKRELKSYNKMAKDRIEELKTEKSLLELIDEKCEYDVENNLEQIIEILEREKVFSIVTKCYIGNKLEEDYKNEYNYECLKKKVEIIEKIRESYNQKQFRSPLEF